MTEKYDTFTYEGCLIDDTFAEMLPPMEISPAKPPFFQLKLNRAVCMHLALGPKSLVQLDTINQVMENGENISMPRLWWNRNRMGQRTQKTCVSKGYNSSGQLQNSKPGEKYAYTFSPNPTPVRKKGHFRFINHLNWKICLCFGVAFAEDLLCTHKSHTCSSRKEKAKRDLSWVAWYRLRRQLLNTNQTSAISNACMDYK